MPHMEEVSVTHKTSCDFRPAVQRIYAITTPKHLEEEEIIWNHNSLLSNNDMEEKQIEKLQLAKPKFVLETRDSH